MADRKFMKKMCLLGDAAVGKTSLIRRYVYDIFDDKYIVTFGAKVTTKQMGLKTDDDNIDLTLIIWDILGQRVHDSLHAGHYKGAKGALVVCDLTRGETIRATEIWIKKLWESVGTVPIILLGNKSDLPHGDAEEDLGEIAKKLGVPCFTTSAKTGINVEKAFMSISETMIKGP
jgi:small GTP-binding protein